MARALLAGLALAGASYLPQVPHRPGRERAAVIAPGGPVAPPAAAARQWRGRRPLVVAMQMEPFQQQQGGGAFGSEDISISSGAAFIVGLDIKRDKYKTLAGDVDQDALWSIDDSLDELQRLCDTAGLQVLGRDYQALQNPSPSTFVGSGKVAELAEIVKSLNIETVVFDDELSPAQQRNLQTALGVQVLDRTMLILQIFAQRARTREAKLQVSLARMRYMLPRLKTFMTTGAGMEAKGGASGGGKGSGGQFLKGAGESQLESDRRLYRKQISRVEAELEQVRSTRELQRNARKKRGQMPLVALVGYTNAGKSSLLNTLCGKTGGGDEVYADDQLFATLDPTMRRLKLPGGKEVMLADTVGFIQKLPTKLISAFRATLEVCEDADVLLHVVDCSSPLGRQQAWSVQRILSEIGGSPSVGERLPQIMALNKADTVLQREGSLPLPAAWVDIHDSVRPAAALAISATNGNNLPKLLEAIEKALLAMNVRIECVLPYAAGELLAELHKVGTIVDESYVDDGTRIIAYAPRPLALRLRKASVRAEALPEGAAAGAMG